ncbi:MAG: hypothetical protein B9S38_02430 [Verrucomicrobiia bacterium Tous-C4TDCM]|nr:MAG: hypothetical protein B9S38_02430 [Verrucomicrobiae bacterium Tous-C4TDCM]
MARSTISAEGAEMVCVCSWSSHACMACSIFRPVGLRRAASQPSRSWALKLTGMGVVLAA